MDVSGSGGTDEKTQNIASSSLNSQTYNDIRQELLRKAILLTEECLEQVNSRRPTGNLKQSWVKTMLYSIQVTNSLLNDKLPRKTDPANKFPTINHERILKKLGNRHYFTRDDFEEV